MHEIGISSKTVVDWDSFCREVCEEVVMHKSQKIGGKDIEVEIDETKIGKRKYNRGRRVEGQWVFGGHETNNRGKMFMVTMEVRTKDTLTHLIKKWIEKGSIIISDCWKSYECL